MEEQKVPVSARELQSSSYTLPVPQAPAIQPTSWWQLKYFCCCIRLSLAIRLVIGLYIATWVLVAIELCTTLALAGGSSDFPGKSDKYIVFIVYIGYSVTFFVSLVAYQTRYDKAFVGTYFVCAKWISILVTATGCIATLARIPRTSSSQGWEYKGLIFTFVIWLLFELYFLIVVKSYAAEPIITESQWRVVPATYPVFVNGPGPAYWPQPQQQPPVGVPVFVPPMAKPKEISYQKQ